MGGVVQEFKFSDFLSKVHYNSATFLNRSVKCVEVNKESKISFEKTLERLPSTLSCNLSWHQADASVVSVNKTDCSLCILVCDSVIIYNLKVVQDPLSWLVGSDVVVVDPPRKGLEPSLVNALQAMSSMERKNKSSQR